MKRRRAIVQLLMGQALIASMRPTFGADAEVSPGRAAGSSKPSRFAVFASQLAQPRGLLFAPDAALYVAEQQSGSIARVGIDGKLVRIASGFESPHDLAFDGDGNLYVADTGAGRIAKIARSGDVTTYIAGLESPVDLDFGPGGELWVCELTGKVRAFATPSRSRTVVQLKGPHGLAFGKTGETFINDWRGNRVYRLDASGSLRPFADIEGPVGLSFGPSGDLYVAQPQAHRVTRIKPDGTKLTLARDLDEPRDPVFDAAGSLYLAETLGGRILKFSGHF
jgi:large repetitive protein